MRFAEVNSCSDGGKGPDGEREQGEEKDEAPSPFIWEHLYDLLSLCLFCDKHFHLHTILEARRAPGGNLAFDSLRENPFPALLPVGPHHVNQVWSTERQKRWEKVQGNKCAKHPLGWEGGKKYMKDIKRGKNSSHSERRRCHLWRAAPYFISFPALSDNQCHIFV